ncbi:hypothetical protein BAE44_0008555 [Dichanthelium oligosanthes]|uniref:DUF4378 domain-containing protein n=1 Tax=Dichanthelium oligosanthes TaxID=888268 RepID=A0A1E5VZ87_9POAL|nr:hypothetical protein BAE44_0008555 [Dichanthelium oligosanthes]
MSMAHHSPSPSGSTSSRRLSELLGEQQEPFYLDLYLLEKGCSPAFLDAAACGSGGGACSTWWPRARTTGGRLLRRRAARSKKGRSRGSGVLRLLLSKILSGATTAPAAATAAKKKRQQPAAAIDWRRRVDDENQRAPGRLKDAAPSPARAVGSQRSMEVDEEQEEDDEEEEDESSKKQLSPDSVLEQRLFEHSPPPPHAQKALVLFSELLEAAYTPTTLLALLANARDSNSKLKDGRRRTNTSSRTAPPWRRMREKSHAVSSEDDTLLKRDIGRVTALVASEMPCARIRPEGLRPWAQDVGADIAAAVLEALTEEAAAEMLLVMGMDHGCAADTARR